MRLIALAIVYIALCGCAAVQSVNPPPPSYPATPPPNIVLPPATAGAIYRSGNELALFQDQRARNPGDLITIQLVENTNASTSSETKTSKKSDMDMSVTSLFGGSKGKANTLLNGKAASGRTFDGSGDSSQSNKLVGNLTVTVAARLPNGNLLVRGEKWIQLNQGNEYVQIQGLIRPADIAPDNSIPSSRVADARIAYGGRGSVANSNVMGWLTKFFNSPYYPM
jgi:flagellar L-ring protein precursor FlgH